MKEFTFTPTQVFTWQIGDHIMGEYHPGMSYNCTNTARHAQLKVMCEQWEKEGKIIRTPLKSGQRFVIQEFEIPKEALDGCTT